MKYKQMIAWQIKECVPKEAQYIMDTIDELYNCESYIVGGSIRNLILDMPVNDWDIATQATPDQIIDMVDVLNSREDDKEEPGFDASYNCGYKKTIFKALPTGIKHGTVTVMVNNKPFEITTFRKDGKYSDGRRPDEVEFATCIEDDLARRDFTINAIALKYQKLNKIDVSIVDPYKGIEDIVNKTIRCVGNPRERFEEDGLRILRALRFAAQLGFEIEEETSKAIHKCIHMLDNVSKERIHDELVKILMSEQCGYKILKEYEDVLRYIVPEAKDADLSFFFDNAQYVPESYDLITRLTLLFISIEGAYKESSSYEITYNALKNLKFDNETVAYVSQLISYRSVPIADTKLNVKRMLSKVGMVQLKRMVSLMKIAFHGSDIAMCTIDSYDKKIKEIIENNECYSLKQLAINGDDLIKAGIPEGKQIKHVLNLCLQLVINESVDNVKCDLLNVVDAIIESNVPFVNDEVDYIVRS